MAKSRTPMWTCLLAGLVSLAGCDNTGSPGAFGIAPVDDTPGNTMEFRSQRGCADCEGIEATLTLEQRGDQRRYHLVEVYRALDRERQFEDQGDWQSSGDLLRLRSADDGERVYLVLPDNRLQATDSGGQPLPALADEVMIPIRYANDR